MTLWDQLLRSFRILDDAADLSGEKRTPLGVGVRVEQQVRVVAGQLGEAGTGPHLLEERAPLIFRVVECGPVVREMEEAGRRRVQRLADRLEVCAKLRLLLVGDRSVVQR